VIGNVFTTATTATMRERVSMFGMFQQWNYNGHQCRIEPDDDGDCIKAWHFVITPDGKELLADITPYDWSREVVERWIDAGYPARYSSFPLRIEDLV
jgi:hypothetical protein